MTRRVSRGVLAFALVLFATALAPQVGSASAADEQYQATVTMVEGASSVATAVGQAAPGPDGWVSLSALPPEAVAAVYSITAALSALAETPFKPSDLEGASLKVVSFPSERRWQLFLVDSTGRWSCDWSHQYTTEE